MGCAASCDGCTGSSNSECMNCAQEYFKQFDNDGTRWANVL